MSITNSTYTSPDWTGYKYPASLAPLPNWMSRGLIALCGFSLLSVITCLALLSYITYLFIVGGTSYGGAVRRNQYVILIYNLVIADLQLAIGFLVSIKWLHDNQIYAPSSACVAQAWLTNVGDLASGLFVLAIAAHTFLAVVFGRKLEFHIFCSIVVGLWVVSVVVTAVPVILHSMDIFVVGGNWCSINPKYDVLRLYCHYIWIFLAEFLVFLLYAITFIFLRHRIGGIMSHFSTARKTALGSGNDYSNFSNPTANNKRTRAERKVSLAAMYMLLYPVVYVIVTLPLAAGRIASLAGNKPSLSHLLIGGSFMTSAGWVDCLLYSLTRRVFLTTPLSTVTGGESQSQRSGSKTGPSKKDGDIELSLENRFRESLSPAGSTAHILHDVEALAVTPSHGGVNVKTTWEVMTKYIEDERDVDGLRHKTEVSAKKL